MRLPPCQSPLEHTVRAHLGGGQPLPCLSTQCSMPSGPRRSDARACALAALPSCARQASTGRHAGRHQASRQACRQAVHAAYPTYRTHPASGRQAQAGKQLQTSSAPGRCPVSRLEGRQASSARSSLCFTAHDAQAPSLPCSLARPRTWVGGKQRVVCGFCACTTQPFFLGRPCACGFSNAQ